MYRNIIKSAKREDYQGKYLYKMRSVFANNLHVPQYSYQSIYEITHGWFL